MTDRFLRACRREPVDKTPVWFMRQAGRYMADYRALRQRYSLLEICANPELAVAVTLQPVDLIEVDAAILFSDLLVPFTPMGLQFDFVKGEGPSIENPVRAAEDVDRLKRFEPRQALAHVLETIRILRTELEGRVPAHWIRRRAVHARGVRDRGRTIDNLRPDESVHVCAACGVAPPLHAVRRHDVGLPEGPGRGGSPGSAALRFVGGSARAERLSRVCASAYVAHFCRARTARVSHSFTSASEPPPSFPTWCRRARDVVGLDWRLPLDEAWAVVGHDRAVQGNLDPTLLLGPEDRLFAAADDILRRAGGRAGHVFNLGHGVLPNTSLEQVQALARHVHEYGLSEKN